ncbi:hypothetical protein [Streptomyces sporangiiformans]|uniref:Uncharacterized protein n=1 Tax=Streptomyces sporangiiformans TaxID=2315329 RepID=A0A505DFT2_9ACTN|nr:hypothetical protein [Streptomyces sporangiiformans]TPQ17956.1 hypothetical protein FGD71_033615 [Streptomyces sporangiiformans]
MGDDTEPMKPIKPVEPRRPEDDDIVTRDNHMPVPGNSGAYGDDGLPGFPLTALLFACAEHAEELVVDYYDPLSPPRCSRGDLMVRKVR